MLISPRNTSSRGISPSVREGDEHPSIEERGIEQPGEQRGIEPRGAQRSIERGSIERRSVEREVQHEPSPYAKAQDGLAHLIEAAVHAQRVEAMNAAMRIDVIFLTVSFALGAEQAFVSPKLSPARRREMARRSVTAELATALRLPERTMQREIDDAWALSTQLPATLSALRSGSLSLQHARVIIEAVAELDDDPRTRADLDEQLASLSAVHTAATVRRRARSLRETLQVQSIAERHRAARAQRRVEIEPALDGMAWLHALLPVADALLIKDRLDRVAREVDESARSIHAAADAADAARFAAGHAARVEHGGPAARVDSEHGAHTAGADSQHGGHTGRGASLTRDQARADAFRDLLLYGGLGTDSAFAAACDRVRPSVHVTVPVETLIGSSDEPGLLDGFGPIDPETARRLAAKAPSFVRLLTDPVTGTVLDVDRTSYRPPADLKRWLQVRDGTCRFPGCNRSADRSDVDHSLDWAGAGRTAFDNLAHLCPLHHHLKHETSWSMRHLAGAVLEWTSPAGRVHRTEPASAMSRGAFHAAETRFAEAPPF